MFTGEASHDRYAGAVELRCCIPIWRKERNQALDGYFGNKTSVGLFSLIARFTSCRRSCVERGTVEFPPFPAKCDCSSPQIDLAKGHGGLRNRQPWRIAANQQSGIQLSSLEAPFRFARCSAVISGFCFGGFLRIPIASRDWPAHNLVSRLPA